MEEPPRPSPTSPVFVGFCAWLLPGLGYWALGQRTRGLTIGITIILLFVGGLLMGGLRILDVPGYGPHGERVEILRDARGAEILKERVGAYADWRSAGWALIGRPFDEIRAKPWFVAQVLTGPVSIAAAAWSVKVSAPAGEGLAPIGARSHSHINEIGVLYTAVAGMLNLLAILDAAHRAAHPDLEAGEVPVSSADAAAGGASV